MLQLKLGENLGTDELSHVVAHNIAGNKFLCLFPIVSTPQDVALADVEKGVNMFRNESVNKPILGLVENMAWFTPAEHPDEKYYIFGKDGGLRMAEKYNIPLLGQIPIVQSIREGGDNGEPAALSSRPDGLAFLEMAQKLAESLA